MISAMHTTNRRSIKKVTCPFKINTMSKDSIAFSISYINKGSNGGSQRNYTLHVLECIQYSPLPPQPDQPLDLNSI